MKKNPKIDRRVKAKPNNGAAELLSAVLNGQTVRNAETIAW